MALRELEITAREPFDGGAAWAPGGSYELIQGVAHFGVDPDADANRGIVDLELAEQDQAGPNGPGEVAFRSDFRILRPLAVPASGTNLLFAVANRGRCGAVPFSLDTPWWDPTRTDIAPGDGFLLRQGWAVAWCGWQWDVISGPASLALEAPEALRDGRSIPGPVRVDFWSDLPMADHALGDSGPYFTFRSYPAEDVDQPDAVLTVRDTVDGDRREIARGRWRFARDVGGSAVADDEHIRLDGGFAPHRFYEVTYRTRRSPVVGAGLLAVRDFVSFLRFAPAAPATPESSGNPLGGEVAHAFAYGASQSGRFLRHFLHQGLNLDEGGHAVFDGVLPHVAGARLGEFNQRYGQPSQFSHSGIGSLPPFSPTSTAPEAGGPEGGLFDRQMAVGALPRVMLTNTSFEYYRGDAALNHLREVAGGEVGGVRDLDLDPATRAYLFAGTDHLGPSPVKTLMPVTNPINQLEPMILLRAALHNLVAWAVEGIEPPPSAVPRVDDGTAVTREAALAAVPDIPGARRPESAGLALVRRTDLGPDVARGVARLPAILGAPYPGYAAAVDADGNEVAGIRLPEVAVPVATYTGWNARRPVTGLPDVLYDFAGSVFPFAATAADREAAGDPRPSVVERYRDRSDYTDRVSAAVARMVADRHLLAGDAATAVDGALELYDRAVAGTGLQAAPAASSTVSSAAGSASSRASGMGRPLRTERP